MNFRPSDSLFSALFHRPCHEAAIMEDTTYTKGIYVATIGVRAIDSGQYQGLVSLARDDGEGTEPTIYEVEASSENESEALEEARALAHRILGAIEL
jgi:hypothetical protein